MTIVRRMSQTISIMHSYRTRAGFTLIEMMAVITIIIILASLVVAGMGFVNERQAKEKARIDIAMLSKAIEEYKLDNGAYPDGPEDNSESALEESTEELYDVLFLRGYESQGTVEEVPIYLPELDPRNSKQSWVQATINDTPGEELRTILDPWRREYFYRTGVNAMNPDFDLWSRGKDGDTDPDDPSSNLPENRDDIRNF